MININEKNIFCAFIETNTSIEQILIIAQNKEEAILTIDDYFSTYKLLSIDLHINFINTFDRFKSIESNFIFYLEFKDDFSFNENIYIYTSLEDLTNFKLKFTNKAVLFLDKPIFLNIFEINLKNIKELNLKILISDFFLL